MIDRQIACQQYTAQYPAEDFDIDLHVIVSDYNFEDHFIFGAICTVAGKLKWDEDNEDLRRRLLFLVALLSLPFPEDWYDED